jgi:YidC/Oxa1 family membrane protein insertase
LKKELKKSLFSVLVILMIVGFGLVGCGPLPTATPVPPSPVGPLGPAEVTATPAPSTAPSGLKSPFDIFIPLIIRPSTEFLKFLYGLLGSYGLAIIVFTLIVRTVLTPLMLQQVRSQKAMSALQPQLQEIQKKYAKDKEKLSQEQMRLYKEAGVNPLGGCLPMLIQMPIMGGLYYALFSLSKTPEFRAPFLWLPNLAEKEGFPYILIITMVASQFLYQRIMTPSTTDSQQQATNRMMQFTPLIFAFMFINFPSGLVLYWVTTNLVSIVQQYLIMRFTPAPATVSISLTESRPQPVTISAPEERPSLGEAFRRLLGLPQPAEETPPAPPPKATSATAPKKPSRAKKKKH